MNYITNKIFPTIIGALILLIAPQLPAADDYITPNRKVIKLPQPQKTGGMPLLDALNKRATNRNYSPKPFSRQLISDLLWAASGINRPDSSKMTAPTTLDWQEIDIYVAVKEGVYLYNKKNNTLELILSKDIMKETGTQNYVGTGAMELIYVANYSKMVRGNPDLKQKEIYAKTDSGFISQNIYLFCAANNLNTVIRGLVPYKELHKTLNLNTEQIITYCQTVGYAPDKQ